MCCKAYFLLFRVEPLKPLTLYPAPFEFLHLTEFRLWATCVNGLWTFWAGSAALREVQVDGQIPCFAVKDSLILCLGK